MNAVRPVGGAYRTEQNRANSPLIPKYVRSVPPTLLSTACFTDLRLVMIAQRVSPSKRTATTATYIFSLFKMSTISVTVEVASPCKFHCTEAAREWPSCSVGSHMGFPVKLLREDFVAMVADEFFLACPAPLFC